MFFGSTPEGSDRQTGAWQAESQQQSGHPIAQARAAPGRAPRALIATFQAVSRLREDPWLARNANVACPLSTHSA